MAVAHGGNLLAVAQQYQTNPIDWIDLSTGVSPFTYPLGSPPASCWNQLPQDQDGLESTATQYYGTNCEPVVVAGSQAAIMSLPSVITQKLGRCGIIALPEVGYKEHQHAWQAFQSAGESWTIEFYKDFPSDEQIDKSDVVLIINPNNPTGCFSSKLKLLELLKSMESKQGMLIVDEAFADCTQDVSLLSQNTDWSNLVVLRSVGKFFGLAGARAGFLFADGVVKNLVKEKIGPWTVSGPTRWAVKQALSDKQWHTETRSRLREQSLRLVQLLEKYLSVDLSGTHLFTTVYLPDADKCHHMLCKEKVLTRLCDESDALRFGLPASENAWCQLESALVRVQTMRKDTNNG